MQGNRTHHPGITVRHSRGCAGRAGRSCDCRPSYQAHVWSKRDGKRIRKTFPTLTEAKAWRHDASVGLRKRTMRAPSRMTLRDAADAWLAGAKDGTIRNRSGDPYKPSVLRGYEATLWRRILPDLGGARLSDIGRNDVQDLADLLVQQGLDPSTLRNALMPLRAIYRRAVARGEIAVNPTSGIELPAVRGKRDRIASPDEAAQLLTAVPLRDRPIWATAMYAGLRLGELRALTWADVDLAVGLIEVRRSWDAKAGPITPKSGAGLRRAPLPGALRDHLTEHKLSCAWAEDGDGLVFGIAPDRPFNVKNLRARAQKAWKAAELRAITLHECRHTFASLMIAAGVNAKALSTYMGHASVTITLDRYGHLMPGNEEEAAGLLDAYLQRASTQARLAQLEPAPA